MFIFRLEKVWAQNSEFTSAKFSFHSCLQKWKVNILCSVLIHPLSSSWVNKCLHKIQCSHLCLQISSLRVPILFIITFRCLHKCEFNSGIMLELMLEQNKMFNFPYLGYTLSLQISSLRVHILFIINILVFAQMRIQFWEFNINPTRYLNFGGEFIFNWFIPFRCLPNSDFNNAKSEFFVVTILVLGQM